MRSMRWTRSAGGGWRVIFVRTVIAELALPDIVRQHLLLMPFYPWLREDTLQIYANGIWHHWWWWTVYDWFSWLQDADERIPRYQTDVKSSLALYSRNKALLKQWQSLIKVVCDHHDHRDNYDGHGDQDNRDHHDQCCSSSMIQTLTKLHGSFSCLILTCN